MTLQEEQEELRVACRRLAEAVGAVFEVEARRVLAAVDAWYRTLPWYVRLLHRIILVSRRLRAALSLRRLRTALGSGRNSTAGEGE